MKTKYKLMIVKTYNIVILCNEKWVMDNIQSTEQFIIYIQLYKLIDNV